MILFHTNYDNVYNTIIFNFLDKDIFELNKDLGDIVEKIGPKYLRREQFKNCENALLDLYNWSSDSYNHELGNIHKIMLHNFLLTILKKQMKNANFKDSYFNDVCNEVIKNTCKHDNCKNNFYDINDYFHQLFKDNDLFLIEKMYKNYTLSYYLSKNQEKLLLYYDILPQEIKDKYNYDYINLFQYIKDLLNYIESESKNKNLANLFWENNVPMNETQIQVVLENIIDAYFNNEEFDITRESLVGSGKIDFKFYRNKNEKILFEIKKANNSHLKYGYENQIIRYMKSWHCKNAFYIIICFTDDDYKKAINFINKHKDTDEYHEFVQIKVLDFRRKRNNRFVNRANFNQDKTKEFDSYFKFLNSLNNIKDVLDVKKFLDTIEGNYYSISDSNLKSEYIRRIHQICSNNCNMNHYMERLLDRDKFYLIYDSHDSIKLLLIRLLGNITNEQKFIDSINSNRNFFDTKIKPLDTKRITCNDIKNILKYLKKEHLVFYNLLIKYNLDIYITDIVDLQSDCDVVVTSDFKTFILGCYYMNDSEYYKKGLINPIYMFFYQLGLVLYFIYSKKYNLEITLPIGDTSNNSKEEIRSIFADMVTLYLMKNSIYEKYCPFNFFEDKIYDCYKEYFSNLLSELQLLELKGDTNDSF